MTRELICPECGGIVGGDGSNGHAPCRCFPTDSGKSDTATLEYLTQPTVTTTTREKTCRICGKDVNGHRRIKDSRGYTCYACAKAEEEAAENDGIERIACAECGKKVRPAGIVEHDGIRICRSCHNHHREMARSKPRVIDSKYHDEHERRRLKIMAAIAGVLILVLLIKWVFGI
jgi:hypothetical protein